MSIWSHLINDKGLTCFEGHAQQVPPQVEDLITLIKSLNKPMYM